MDDYFPCHYWDIMPTNWVTGTPMREGFKRKPKQPSHAQRKAKRKQQRASRRANRT